MNTAAARRTESVCRGLLGALALATILAYFGSWSWLCDLFSHFRVQYAVPGLPRRRVDVAFTKYRLAVFVDGCFWHGCPQHFIEPHRNRVWWRTKIGVNQTRDRDSDDRLQEIDGPVPE